MIECMKKIILVNNNMKVGGVQKSLYNLLWAIHGQYDITLYLFQPIGEYMEHLPPDIRVQSATSLFRYLGMSQGECKKHLRDRVIRGALATGCRLLGRDRILKLMLLSQKRLGERFDCAISFLHNGHVKSFYGGVNEFVLSKISADKKIAFLHCDYGACGGNYRENNQKYVEFDAIAACSEGCRRAFLRICPQYAQKCYVVRNCHRFDEIQRMARLEPYCYDKRRVNVLTVARLSHEKGVERGIRAVAKAVQRSFQVSYHIVGDGKMRSELERLSKELGVGDCVHFYGEQSNPYRYMVNADLFLLTSYHEAAPLVIQEAQSLGLPVLSVETTSSHEMVTEVKGGWVCENEQGAIDVALAELVKDTERLQECKSMLLDMKIENELAVGQFGLITQSQG